MVCPLVLAVALLASGVAWTAAPSTEAEIRALFDAGQKSEAVAAARSVVEQSEGSGGPELAAALDLLVELLIAADRAAEPEATELAERAVSAHRVSSSPPAELASSLTRLGDVLTASNELKGAATALTEAEALYRASVGEGSDLGRVLNRLAAARKAEGGLREAARLYASALAALERSPAAEEEEREKALAGLGDCSYNLRDLTTARSAYQQLLESRVLTLGEGDAAVGEALYRLAATTAGLGELAPAEELYRRAIAVLEVAIGPDYQRVGDVLNMLAVTTRKRGDFLEARRLSERALVIYEHNLGPDHPFVAGTLNNLGSVLLNLGNLPAARAAHERALAIREHEFGPDSLEVAQSLNNLGSLSLRAEEAGQAVRFYERALAIRERALGVDSPAVGLVLSNLGEALRESGQLERSRESLQRAVEILERSPEHAWILGDALNNLGVVLLRQGRFVEAAGTLERARRIVEVSRGHDHPRTATQILNQAESAVSLGQLDLAMGLALEATRIRREHLHRTASGLSEREALAYANQHRSALDLALSLALEPEIDDPTLRAAAWDAVIRSRGLVLNEMASRRQLLSTGDPTTALLADALRTAASRYSGLLIEGPETDSVDEIEAARHELERAERALAEASPPFAKEQLQAAVGLEEVASNLPAASALVAFVRFRRSFTGDPARRHEADQPWYAAFVRSPGGTVEVIDLGDAAGVELLVEEWRSEASLSDGSERVAREAGELLRRAIWDPVAARLGDPERVAVVSDGALGLVNLAALPIGADAFLVEQGPLLIMLDHEQDQISDPILTVSGPCLLALGAPDYDAAPSGPVEAPASSNDVVPGSGRSAPSGLDGRHFTPLPGTAAETAEVVALWTAVGRHHSSLRLIAGDATEAAFKTLAPGSRILHLATHGFFLADRLRPATSSERGVGGLVPANSDPTESVRENAFRLSGLVLAGANRRDVTGAEDGILTAEEIAVLDLSGVEWAVLSACESGVGEASSLEGVFGLRRAFRVAGARTVIMSLWAVDDEAAREWMIALYRARLAERLPTAEAVRRASLSVLAARRQRGDSIHPASWAAFVAAGDWR